mmetsp:Transcript_3614/g.7828  ORF Transcript_3614/g.7828 Transcript_3614/m.7828 type:complete len:582 (-) Transcript_3614:984-2729(-)|eukprot:CAMPEP_0202895338 /NCGR_PEP_ID=MMETSP1392-20130828/4566_1 /ASSEMBLY_ACC=CAM_ASM_000868 /TAXON_ID=225041 /ORGANISM="Chlamydomonas chlamydogama, Strain SAG 11-48b" /LENGTH=581 /DNA_ID=CAMNT_0049580319 /DNA_START=247 /DNA_END=1992 /DNA_ORIENTATION=-
MDIFKSFRKALKRAFTKKETEDCEAYASSKNSLAISKDAPASYAYSNSSQLTESGEGPGTQRPVSLGQVGLAEAQPHPHPHPKAKLTPRASAESTRSSTKSQSGPHPSACPPFGSKSVVGRRFHMEDSWVAVPELIRVPTVWTADLLSDKLPSSMRNSASATSADPSSAPDNPHQHASTAAARLGPLERGALAAEPLATSDPAGAPLADSMAVPSKGDVLHLFAVFDGHGGAEVAKHCSKMLHEHLRSIIQDQATTHAAQQQQSKSASTPTTTTPSSAASSYLLASAATASATDGTAASQPTTSGTGSPSHSATATDGTASTTTSTTPDASSTPAAAAAPAAVAADGNTIPVGAAAGATAGAATAAGAGATAMARAATAAELEEEQVQHALIKAFLQVDRELEDVTANQQGSTAVVALVGRHHIWVANCGDSRAVLAREGDSLALSSDHKATRNDEVVRVEQAGGYVWWDRVMGELAVSRAIGDHCLRPYVIANPEVTRVMRRREDRLLILASDGLWDVFSNEEACALAISTFQVELEKGVSSSAAAKKVASSLTKGALSKGTRDNVTVVVVDVSVSTHDV